jgi:glycosyltransferase involved in cell wall biosynthesis
MKISVAMCTYNGSRYLSEQLQSIAAQTHSPFELVVCDDGSSDQTRRIVSDFAATVSFPVDLHVNEQRLGSTKNFERVIGLCAGEVIALADQDDIWLPEKLSLIDDCFQRLPGTGLVFTDAEVIDEKGNPAGYSLWEKLSISKAELERLQKGEGVNDLLQGATITGTTMAFRACFRELVLPIPTDLSLIHDAWIAILVAAVSDVLPLSSPLVRYRQHEDQQVGAKQRQTDKGSVWEAMQRKTSYQQMIDIGTQAQQRLSERRDVYHSEEALDKLAARLTHLRTRAKLPGPPLQRFTCVIRELLTGRYHVYSRGFFSAAKDLLHPGSGNPST